MKSPPKLSDLAQLAGVSESTVSRALSGSGRMSAETRNRIREIARREGYSVNAGARALRTRSTRTIEVVIPLSEHNRQNFSDPFFSELIAAIGDALAVRGFDLLLSKLPPWSDNDMANAVRSGRADGLILIGQGRAQDDIEKLAREGYPMVVWGAPSVTPNCVTVGTDNFLGGRLAGEHLVAQGRLKVAFLGDVRHREINLRQAGLQQALHDADAGPGVVTVAMPFDEESAIRATTELFQSGPYHDAIFAASDLIALGAMRALYSLGLRVPEDVAVIGYDDIRLSQYARPSLTTIRQEVSKAGEALVSQLFKILSGEAASSVLLETRLIARESTAPQA